MHQALCLGDHGERGDHDDQDDNDRDDQGLLLYLYFVLCRQGWLNDRIDIVMMI